MRCIGTPDRLVAHRRVTEGRFVGTLEVMFESEVGAGPQAFLARQAPNWHLPQHFHQQHQFQVVVEGGGTLGRHALAPVTVHYASPQAVYGPIVSNDDGLAYFTLRVLADQGVWYMPERREAMSLGMFKEQCSGAASIAGTPPVTTLIEARDDGLGAWLLRPGAGAPAVVEAPCSPAGRFHIVARGAYTLDGQRLPRLACVYVSPPDESPALVADDDDSVLVVVQFPAQAITHHVPREVVASATMLSYA